MFSFILLCISLFSIVSSGNIKPKFCKNCKYFIPSQDKIDKHGKCSMFPILLKRYKLFCRRN